MKEEEGKKRRGKERTRRVNKCKMKIKMRYSKVEKIKEVEKYT